MVVVVVGDEGGMKDVEAVATLTYGPQIPRRNVTHV